MPAIETNPTNFLYSIEISSYGFTAISMAATGTGFAYEAEASDPDPISGIIETFTFSIDLTVDVDGVDVPVTYTFLEMSGLSYDVDQLGFDADAYVSAIPFRYVGFNVGTVGSQITADAEGTILDAPNAMQFYANEGLTVLGTDTSDHITLYEVTRRVDTVAGDDVLVVTTNAGDLEAFLRSGDDLFYGAGMSADTTADVIGGVGDDRLIAGAGDDFLRGMQDDDILLGGFGDDRLVGGSQDDFIFGGADDDQMFGGSGQDVLHGGSGQNAATGGLGQDVFVMEFGLSETRLIVHDFADGLDTLHFSEFGQGDMSAADAAALFEANSIQNGADTVLTYGDSELVLKDVSKADITEDDFYDKPWLLITELEVYGGLF